MVIPQGQRPVTHAFLPNSVRDLQIIGARSRDNGRTPMQWDGSQYAGFSTVEPWLGIPANHSYINVEAEKKDPKSSPFCSKHRTYRFEGNHLNEPPGRTTWDGSHRYNLSRQNNKGREPLWTVLTGTNLPVRFHRSDLFLQKKTDPSGTDYTGKTCLREEKSTRRYVPVVR